MANYTAPKSKPSSKPLSTDSFLEALRDLGASSAKGAVNQGMDLAGDVWGQLTGNYSSNQNDGSGSKFPQFPQEQNWPQEAPQSFKKQAFFERQKNAHEKVVFSKAEEQTRLQIQSIQEEIKKLAASTQNLAKEVQVAALQAPVSPGTYHLSFFEKLRRTIIEIKRRIEESASWLAAFNGKSSKKQGYYWTQVNKSGSKYMLSQERYMQTSAG